MRRTNLLIGTALFALAAVPAFAQAESSVANAPKNVNVQDAQETADADDPDAIIVTAQKRAQKLQDVPVAVSIVTGDQIRDLGGVNIANVQYLIPALNFRQSGTSLNQSLFLRGVGTINFSIAAEPSVAVVLDGVVLSRAGEGFGDLYDVERIEALPGPQGTLFGKNASAGVVQIISQRPTRDMSGYVEGSYYSENEWRGRATLNFPVSDKLLTRVTGFYGQYDGNIENVAANVQSMVNGYKHYGIRGMAEFQASDNVSLLLIADYRKAEDDCCAEVIATTPVGITAGALPGVTIQGNETRQIEQNLVTATNETSWGVSLEADIALGENTLTSITAYRSWDNQEIRDGDFLSQPYVGVAQLHDDGPQTGTTFSQELRIASPSGVTFEWTAGAYYSRSVSERTFTRNDIVCTATTLPAISPGLFPCSTAPGVSTVTFPSGTANFGSTISNIAAFGQGTWNFNDQLRAIGGLRLTLDNLDVFHGRDTKLSGPGINPSGPVVGGVTYSIAYPWPGSTSSSNLSGKVGLQYDIVPESTAYATYSRGYKGPAFNIFFNLTATGIGAIEPETVNAFELGLKNSLFDGKMALNLAAWYAKYYNYQANNPDLVAGVVVTRLTNAGNVSTQGASLDLIWRPMTNLSFSGGIAYTDAQVDQFKVPPGGNPAAVVPSGTQLPNAPTWKMTLGGNYTIETGGFANINLGFQSAYQSSQLSQLDASAAVRAATTIPAYGILDLTAGIAAPDGRWSLLGTVKNVFDQSFAASITTGGPGGSLRYIIPREADRYWGLTARVGF